MMNDRLTTVTGNYLVLSDCKGSRFSDFNMFGHSDQVTTTGSQLFDIITATPTLDGSVIDEHTIRVVNVNTQIIDPTTSLSSHLKAGHTYHISAVAKKVAEPPNVADLMIGNNTKGFIVRVEQTNDDGTVKGVNLPEIRNYTQLNINDTVKVSGNFTIPDTYTGKASLFLHASNHKDDSDNRYFDTIDYIDIMISEGTEDKPWEPYTGGKPSPSPEYPQEIVSVGDGGNIELKVSGENMEVKQATFAYEPYKEQSITIPLSEPLRKVYISLKDMYIRDRICRKDGVWGIERWCFKLILDESSRWGTYAYTNKQGIVEYYGFKTYDTSPLPHSSRRAGFSNMFPVVEKGTSEHMEIWLGVDSDSVFVVGIPQWDGSLPDNGLSNWMRFLSENPLEIVSYLDEPIFEPFADDIQSALNSLYTYASETSYISNSENSEMMIIYRQLNNREG